MRVTAAQGRGNSDGIPTGRVRPAASRPGAPPGRWRAKMPPGRAWLWFGLILLANYFLVRLLMPSPEGPLTVPYTLFKAEVGPGNVAAIHSQGYTITGRFKAPVTYPSAGTPGDAPQGPLRSSGEPSAAPGGGPRLAGEPRAAQRDQPRAVTTFTTMLPSFVDPGLEAFLIAKGVESSAKLLQEGSSPWATLFFAFGPALLFIGLYVWMFRRAAQQGGGLGGWAHGHRPEPGSSL
jgi:cell division protease FtsH